MFGKCVKHELRATHRTLIPLCLSTLAVSAVIGLLAILNGRVFAPSERMEGYELVTTMFMGMMVFALFAMMISVAAVSFVLIIRRFYTSFFTDEGYLSFTLPVTVHHHVLSKFLIAMLWTLVAALCAILCGALIGGGVWIGYGTSMEWLGDVLMLSSFEPFWDLFLMEIVGVGDLLGTGTVILGMTLSVLRVIALLASTVLSIYFAIAFSSMLAKKNRLILGIAVYWLVNLVFSLLEDVFLNVIPLDEMAADTTLLVWSSVSLAWAVIRFAACYVGTVWIMQKKLNLD